MPQGKAFEDFLEPSLGGSLNRFSHFFKTFDFYDRESRIATSAKTLDTEATTYRNDPKEIFRRIAGYVDAAASFTKFKRGTEILSSGQISTRVLQLAVPANLTRDQLVQIELGAQYAEMKGIAFKLTVVR